MNAEEIVNNICADCVKPVYDRDDVRDAAEAGLVHGFRNGINDAKQVIQDEIKNIGFASGLQTVAVLQGILAKL